MMYAHLFYNFILKVIINIQSLQSNTL